MTPAPATAGFGRLASGAKGRHEMSAVHPVGAFPTLTEFLEHLDEEHWSDLDAGTDRDPVALGPCDVCGDPVTDRYGFGTGPGSYTVDICRDHAGLYGRRSY